jgi:hypothetical protein
MQQASGRRPRGHWDRLLLNWIGYSSVVVRFAWNHAKCLCNSLVRKLNIGVSVHVCCLLSLTPSSETSCFSRDPCIPHKWPVVKIWMSNSVQNCQKLIDSSFRRRRLATIYSSEPSCRRQHARHSVSPKHALSPTSIFESLNIFHEMW